MASALEIPGFRITGEMGRGATSVVYAAEREDRRYAVKVFNRVEAVGDPMLLFRREAAALARLRHDSLVQVHECGEHRGAPYLVMELVDGRSLAEQLADGPLGESRAAEIAAALASALAEVHRRGMVHRDLKPANILLDPTGRPKLIDFGLAVSQAGELPSEAAGTFLYAPPEQSGRLKRPVDGRSDLYALGAVLFECLAGRPPFVAEDTAALLELHLSQPAPDLRTLRPEVSPALAAIVAKLLAKDPDDRYPTAEALVADLGNLSTLDAQLRAGSSVALGRADLGMRRRHEVALVGRRAELRQLLEVWERAREGRGGVVLVEGEGGSGKTRLVRELMGRVAAGRGIVLAGKAQQSEPIALGVFREAIDDYVSRLMLLPPGEKAEAVERLRKAAGPELPRLIRLSRGLERLVGKSDGADALLDDRERFNNAVADFLCQLAQLAGQGILFLDDVQWLDDASAQLLRRLASRLDSAPLLVACTSRNDAASESALEVLVTDLGATLARRLRLAPLSRDDAAELLTELLGGHPLDAEAVDRLAARARGNPFALGEYLRAMLDAGAVQPATGSWTLDPSRLDALALPNDVLELVASRMRGLSLPTRELLAAAAVAGMEFRRALLLRATGASADALARAFLEALGASIVEEKDEATLCFVHDRLREGLLSSLTPERLRDLNQQLAEALEAVDDGTAERVYALARHYARGWTDRNPRRVFETALDAGRRAIADFAFEDAYELLKPIAFLAADAEPGQRRDYEEAIARASHGTGRTDEALEHYGRALELTRDPIAISGLRRRRAEVLQAQYKPHEGMEELLLGLKVMGGNVPRSVFGCMLSALGNFLIAGLMYLVGIRSWKVSDAERERARAIARLYLNGMENAWFIARLDLLLAFFGKALLLAPKLGRCIERADLLVGLFINLASLRLRGVTQAAESRAIALAEELGDRTMLAYVKHYAVLKHEPWGECRTLDARYEEYFRSPLMQWLDKFGVSNLTGMLVANLILRGRVGRATDEIQRYNRQALAGLGSSWLVMSDAHHAAAHAIRGQLPEAARYAEPALKLVRSRPPVTGDSVFVLAHVLVYLLEIDSIGADADAAIDLFEGYGLSPMTASFHYQLPYVYGAYVRQRQLFADPTSARRRAFRRAVRQLAEGGQAEQSKCHAMVLRACLDRLDGRYGRARRALVEAERLAAFSDSSWGLFEAARERARLAGARGDADEQRRAFEKARELAAREGWVMRLRALKAEFPQLEEAARSSVPMSAPTIHVGAQVPTSATRYLEALLQTSLASASSLDPAQQARAALDAVVSLLHADRAFLFLCDGEGAAPRWQGGREAGGRDVAAATEYSSTAVQKVVETRKPLVLAGTEAGAQLGSESAVAFDLRSIMAAPMMLRDQLVGVVYVDNRLIKGLFSNEDASVLTAIGHQIAISFESARAARLELERQAIEKDIELTARVQALFMPRELAWSGPNSQLAAFYRPAQTCGGDWWWHEDDGDRQVLLIGDATGHGIAPAMVTAIVASCYGTLRDWKVADSLADTLRALSHRLHQTCRGDYQMQMSALCVNHREMTVEWLSAAALPICVLHADGKRTVLQARGLPLGGDEFSLGSVRQALRPGDRIWVSSDGVPELMLPGKRQLGARRALQIVESTRTLPLLEARDKVVAELDLARQGTPQDDDLTFALLEVRGPAPR